MKIIVTGCAGFIGSNFVDYLLNNTNDFIIGIDSFTYAADYKNIENAVKTDRFIFYNNDINDKFIENIIIEHKPDIIVNFAAETHVDNSIKNPDIFIKSNINGTFNLLELSRKYNIRFHQISTDEVYGDLPLNMPNLKFTESSMIKPSSPYSASKAAADLLVMSYYRTYGLKTSITRCSNNYGPKQNKEKLIPKAITNFMNNQKIGIYGNGINVRDWLYVYDHCDAVYKIITNDSTIGQIYNVGGNNEMSNNQIITEIMTLMNKDNMIEYIIDRPGHDLRYAIDSSKLQKELNWTYSTSFKNNLMETIKWYMK